MFKEKKKKTLERPPENLENYCSRTSGSSERKYKEIKGGSKTFARYL